MFSVDLTEDATFCKITIGDHEGPTYSKAELESKNWTVDLALN